MQLPLHLGAERASARRAAVQVALVAVPHREVHLHVHLRLERLPAEGAAVEVVRVDVHQVFLQLVGLRERLPAAGAAVLGGHRQVVRDQVGLQVVALRGGAVALRGGAAGRGRPRGGVGAWGRGGGAPAEAVHRLDVLTESVDVGKAGAALRAHDGDGVVRGGGGCGGGVGSGHVLAEACHRGEGQGADLAGVEVAVGGGGVRRPHVFLQPARTHRLLAEGAHQRAPAVTPNPHVARHVGVELGGVAHRRLTYGAVEGGDWGGRGDDVIAVVLVVAHPHPRPRPHRADVAVHVDGRREALEALATSDLLPVDAHS